MELSNSLAARYWNYSLSAYAQTGVQALCLQLQRDHQANVNLLLFGGFLGCSGLVLTADDWLNLGLALTPLNQRYTQRIRRLREGAKQFAGLHTPANKCYQQLKALELQAERIEQLIIAGSCDNDTRVALMHRHYCAISDHILHNLLGYYANWPTSSSAVVKALHELAALLLRNGETKGNLSQL